MKTHVVIQVQRARASGMRLTNKRFDRLEFRGSPDIGCNPRRPGRRGHLAFLPAAPSSIHTADRLALRSQRVARDSDHGKERDLLEKLI